MFVISHKWGKRELTNNKQGFNQFIYKRGKEGERGNIYTYFSWILSSLGSVSDQIVQELVICEFMSQIFGSLLADRGKARGCSKSTLVINSWIDWFSQQNWTIGSKVTVRLQNGWILPIGGVTFGRVWSWGLCSRLVLEGFDTRWFICLW